MTGKVGEFCYRSPVGTLDVDTRNSVFVLHSSSTCLHTSSCQIFSNIAWTDIACG